MKRNKFLLFEISLVVLVLLPKMECQVRLQRPWPVQPGVPPRPLCASQFALVNYACARLSVNPAPPLTPPSPPSSPPAPPPDDRESGHGRSHGHRRRHRHGHRRRETQLEENCCRWLKEVDNECVCDLLVHLPVFLARPVHDYTVIVDETCSVTYRCAGRIKP